MDCSSLDESDEPQTPLRSPSRLDFCIEDLGDGGSLLEAGDDSETHGMDWACTPFHDNGPHTFIEEEALVVDIAPPDHPRLLITEGGEDDPPQAMDLDSHPHANADTLRTSPMPRKYPMDQVVVEPQSPLPVRPLLVHFQLNIPEVMPPSRTAPQRLNYPHHGFSRSALLQQKTLWNSRHEEWAEWSSRMEQGNVRSRESETNDAYTGLATTRQHVIESPPPYMRTPRSGLERDLADHPPRKHDQDAHASIFPRVGDISALRDPYSVNIDRCFFKFPLWTLRKMLYMFDMHQGSTSLVPSASVHDTPHVEASMSSSTLSSYTSSASGDDEGSDSTLVADDSPIPQSQLPLEPLRCASSPHSPSPWNHFCGWELSWYARWELLIGLFQRDHIKCDTLEMSMELVVPVESKATPPSPPEPIFRFTVGEDGDDNDDDEDEDYGRVVSDSTFGVDFDEECERAMASCSRVSRCSEMVLQ
ncbi:hypothetical protein J3R82DRAFT_7046 [Butyriboletus roseoflavus]|nr:hypothetical protein J3R82DRAFT_7046 [Butyriboletus roseoflavus]